MCFVLSVFFSSRYYSHLVLMMHFIVLHFTIFKEFYALSVFFFIVSHFSGFFFHLYFFEFFNKQEDEGNIDFFIILFIFFFCSVFLFLSFRICCCCRLASYFRIVETKPKRLLFIFITRIFITLFLYFPQNCFFLFLLLLLFSIDISTKSKQNEFVRCGYSKWRDV